MTVNFEPIIGRYFQASINDQPHRIYMEEAGQGIPLLCLHTAGSDGRQYRSLLNSKQITNHFRVICFDMPWHGKSSPPPGWHKKEYKLTSQQYQEMILSVIETLNIERPVVMGCSIGGRIVLHLARNHPEKFRALIGLQSGAHVNPYYDLEYLHRPDINGQVCAAIVSGLIGPNVPEDEKWETLWHYMQAGPGIFKGDLHFYTDDGDIREDLSDIDTQKCPLYLLTGEYDYSSTPEDTVDLVNRIPGCDYQLMTGLGHFPMSEDPPAFIEYLHPILNKIMSQPSR
ncbi:MAG: alpha/beta hydrolase [Methylocystaceae bacterium]|nr:alpha/beta hydrolase [Methylocystaceae bacterium]